jgi:hypothetical protein
MQVTTKKIVDHREEVTYHDTYNVRVQIKKGVIVTVECLFEDGEFQDWKAKTDKDQKIIDKLSKTESGYLDEILEKVEID